VAYMDPGNWATSLAGGSKFGYALLFIALLSNIMAIILQALCARLGVASGRDLAQACRDAFPRWVSYPLWALAELAICATDLAEVIGTAIGLNLLFGIPLEIGVILTALDVFLILWMQKLGFRWIEAFIVTLLGVIAVCFAIQIAMADPDWGAVIRGFAPTTSVVTNPDMLYLSLGILGATGMPHNLSLPSGVVQTRRFGASIEEKREAVKLASIDSTVALMFALTINASILILDAANFTKVGKTDVAELDQAHSLLAPLLGSAIAPTLFGIALLCCGLNSTVTATLSGQIVMEGFLDIRLPGWARRLITRAIAIVPAAIVTIWFGEKGSGQLLILSQVILSLQLPFAIVPLVMFTADRKKMGDLAAPRWVTALAMITAATIIALNIKLLFDFAVGSGCSALRFRVVPACRHQAFLWQEAALVIHLAGTGDPIAEIDVRQAHAVGPLEWIEDHESAERAVGLIRIEKRIDHRQAVAEHIGESDREHLSRAAPGEAGIRTAPAVFDQTGVDVAVFDHHRVIEDRHVGHATVAMARIEIGAKDRILLGRGRGCAHVADNVGIAFGDAAHVTRGREVGGHDAHGDAGAAPLAGWAIGDRLAAAEAPLGQQIVELARAAPHKGREH